MNLEALGELIPWLVAIGLGAWALLQGRTNKRLKKKRIEDKEEMHKIRNKHLEEKIAEAKTVWAKVIFNKVKEKNRYRSRRKKDE